MELNEAVLEGALSDAEVDRDVRRLAWPAIGEMVLNMFVWIVDTAMVGHLGAYALSAVGLGGSVYWTAVWVSCAVATGTSAMVARAVGAGDARRASFVAGQGLIAGFALGVVLSLAVLGAAPWFYRLAGFGADVSVDGVAYVRIVAAGAVLFLPTQVGSGILRGHGDTRTPMLVTLVMNSINVVGDYALVFGALGFPALGVRGAATATLAAHSVGGALILIALFAKGGKAALRRSNIARAHWPTLRSLLRLSFPAGLEEALMNGSRTVSSFIIASLGATAFAAHQVTVAAESLSFMPGYGFALASGVLVGQSLGARMPERAMRTGYRAVAHAAAVMGGVGLLFLAAPTIIVRLFTNDAEVVRIASTCLRIAAFEQVAIGVTDTFCGSLRGAGDTRSALRITATGTWLVRIPLTVLAIYVLRLGLPAVWVITCLDWAVRALLSARHFRVGRWREVKLH